MTIERSATQAGTQRSGSQKLDWRSVPFHVIPIVLLPGKTWQGLYFLFVTKDISSSCVRPMDNVYYCPLFPHDVGLSGSVAMLLGLASPMLIAYAVRMVAAPAAPAWLLERSHGILRVVSGFSHTRALLGSR